MEEKIPQLTLTPDLGKEPVLEPVKEEDLIEKAEKAVLEKAQYLFDRLNKS